MATGVYAAKLARLGDEDAGPVEIPYTQLSKEALHGLIEEFVSRDGTDYGARERSLGSKVAEVEMLLERGEARVVFDPTTGTANIIVAA